MSKCKYIYDKQAGKVLIPGCMAVAHTGKMEDCTCISGDSVDETFKQFENRLFRQKIIAYITDKEKLSQQIKELEKENARLWRMIRKLNK